MAFERFRKSEHMPDLQGTFSMRTRARISDLKTKHEDRLARFLRAPEHGPNWRPSTGAHLGADHPRLGANGRGGQTRPRGAGSDRKALERRLRELAILATAAMNK